MEGAVHRFADAGGLKVHYAEAGDPAAPPLLLLHGWPQNHSMWGSVVAALDERFRIIVPDLRGFGWTEAPGKGYNGETFARDQVALLDALGIESAHVLGHDWGGWTGFLLGLDHAERVERMIICNVPHPWARPRPRLFAELWRTWYVAANASPGLGRFAVPRTARSILRRGNVDTPFTPEEIEAYAERFRGRERARASVELYRYYFRVTGDGLRGAWASRRLATPTLLLFGEQDRYVTVHSVNHPEDYEAHTDDMTVELVPDSGHFIVDEKPHLVVKRALSQFGT
jgi:pimeloyl-ACP methyl ester carboxylesterase